MRGARRRYGPVTQVGVPWTEDQRADPSEMAAGGKPPRRSLTSEQSEHPREPHGRNVCENRTGRVDLDKIAAAVEELFGQGQKPGNVGVLEGSGHASGPRRRRPRPEVAKRPRLSRESRASPSPLPCSSSVEPRRATGDKRPPSDIGGGPGHGSRLCANEILSAERQPPEPSLDADANGRRLGRVRKNSVYADPRACSRSPRSAPPAATPRRHRSCSETRPIE